MQQVAAEWWATLVDTTTTTNNNNNKDNNNTTDLDWLRTRPLSSDSCSAPHDCIGTAAVGEKDASRHYCVCYDARGGHAAQRE